MASGPITSCQIDWETVETVSDFIFFGGGLQNHSEKAIPGTGEPGGLPSMGSHRVGHD